MKLGIDIGGTFTDLVLLDEKTGELHFGKTLTTYPNPADGIMKGTSELLQKTGLTANKLEALVHGTTLVTNAVIERRGAKTGFITTKGFEDTLEIGRELRYDIYDLFLTVPEPLVPRNLRLGVAERVDKNGNIIEAIDEAELAKVITHLAQKEKVESIGVCFLHSFTNPQHEQAVGKYLKAKFPHIYFSLSSEVMPEIREYERSSATAMNAYVQPITTEYLNELERRMGDLGFAGNISIMISSGRLTTIAGASATPIQLLESGPAGGSMAGVFFGELTGNDDLFVFDMGGTTAKASLIRQREPEITNQFEAGRVKRFKKGSGLPVRIPVIDMIEIGAGGGSLAQIDGLGLLKVGPKSASSQPGPACYGRGGKQPTVTDADLVLGYLNEDYFLGGTMSLDKEAARAALKSEIADKLNITIEEAAMGIHRIVNENMANAARVHILEKGYDPRSFSMIAFGGAGPVHAFQVARLLGVRQMIIPVGAGVTSALGFLVSPMASEEIRSHVSLLENMDWAKVNQFLGEMEDKGFAFLANADIPKSQANVSRLVDMRYQGQGHEITVKIPNETLSKNSETEIAKLFEQEYLAKYGRSIEDVPIETVTWRVIVSGESPKLSPKQVVDSQNSEAYKGTRKVFLMNESTAIDCPVYDRYALNPSQKLEGPLIIEEMESTTIVGRQAKVRVDEYKNIIIDLLYD